MEGKVSMMAARGEGEPSGRGGGAGEDPGQGAGGWEKQGRRREEAGERDVQGEERD